MEGNTRNGEWIPLETEPKMVPWPCPWKELCAIRTPWVVMAPSGRGLSPEWPMPLCVFRFSPIFKFSSFKFQISNPTSAHYPESQNLQIQPKPRSTHTQPFRLAPSPQPANSPVQHSPLGLPEGPDAPSHATPFGHHW